MIEFLLKQDVLPLFAEVIKATNCKSLPEIQVGILANMCDPKKARDELCLQESQLLEVFIGLPSGSFKITTAYAIVGFLQSKLSSTLAKFALLDNPAKSFTELFIKSEVVSATMEAFNTILTDNAGQENDTDALEEKEIKIKQTFAIDLFWMGTLCIVLTHTGEKPYQCALCPWKFNQSSSSTRHLNKLTKSKPSESSQRTQTKEENGESIEPLICYKFFILQCRRQFSFCNEYV
uniref:C2H2-type domain-containing protein n=1 Tax=Glossina palpalis gambiensis TaxID=67801 RepID=A0A1B0B0K4_9MUSC